MPGIKHAPFAVFTQTYHRTMPLIYSGQEEPVLRAVSFFEKDSMGFKQYARVPFYSALLHLRKSNKAFADNAQFKRLTIDHPAQMMAYERTNGKDRVVVVLNFSDVAHEVLIKGTTKANYQELFTNEKTSDLQLVQLPAWGYKVYVQQNK
jgi:glycosidase